MTLLLLTFLKLTLSDIQIQNDPDTQRYSISFYLQGVDGSPCGDSINNVQILNNQTLEWVNPSQYWLNTGNGDKYEYDCDGVNGCDYNLPLSVLLSTINGNPITLTNVIQNYYDNYVFTTKCQLCRGTEICYAPTPSSTVPPTFPTLSPTNSSLNPTVAPLSLVPFHSCAIHVWYTNTIIIYACCLSLASSSADRETITYVDVQYIILNITILFIVSLVFGSTCYKFCKQRRANSGTILKPIQVTALIVMLSFLLSYMFWLVTIFNENDNIIFEMIENLSFSMGWFALYIFMFYRLYHTFKDSVYEMSKIHIYFHVIVSIFIPIWYYVMHLAKIFDRLQSFLLLAAVGCVLLLIGLLLLIITFNKNLFNAILLKDIVNVENSNIARIESDDDDDDMDNIDDVSSISYDRYDDDDNDEDETEDENALLTVITKQTLLGSIMTISMMLFVLIIVMLIMTKTERNNTEWIVHEWFLGIVVIINCLCIFFGFKMNEKEYNILFQKCHNKLFSSYHNLALKKRRNKLNESLLNPANGPGITPAQADLTIDSDYYIHK